MNIFDNEHIEPIGVPAFPIMDTENIKLIEELESNGKTILLVGGNEHHSMLHAIDELKKMDVVSNKKILIIDNIPQDIRQVPNIEELLPPMITQVSSYESGKELRRKRRANERKLNKYKNRKY